MNVLIELVPVCFVQRVVLGVVSRSQLTVEHELTGQRVEHAHVTFRVAKHAFAPLHGDAGIVADLRRGSGQPVEKRGLAGIGRADQRHAQRRIGMDVGGGGSVHAGLSFKGSTIKPSSCSLRRQTR